MLGRVRTVGVVCAAVMIAGASCTTTVDSTTGPAGTTAATTGTTVGNYGSSVTTAPPTTTRSLTAAELEELLPTAAEIGPGYSVVTMNDAATAQADEEWNEATRDACPELYEVSSDFAQLFTVAYSQAPTFVQRVYADAATREVEVDLTDGADFIPTEEQLDKLIAATNSCDMIRLSDEQTGNEVSMKLRANPDSHYGDLGMVMTMDIKRTSPLLPRTVKSSGHVRTFQRGETTVSITTIDGIDLQTLRPVPVDYRLAADLAEELDGEIQRLQGD
ncbi:MAG TPA: hypothetical protein VFN21_08810 [Acidimicrobiales bacterium]|nr:hypothetical protein [Acidimicrobiales bacterium]